MPRTHATASPRLPSFAHPVRRARGCLLGAIAATLWTPSAYADAPIEIKGSYVVEVGHNTQGGDRELTRAAGQLLVGATFDLDRLWGIEGGTAQVTITNRHGDSLTNDAGLGLLQPAHSVYGRGEITRLTHFWYEHAWDGTALKIGRMTMGDDFASAPCNFTNLTLCGPAPSQIAAGYLFNVPVSTWGVRLRQRLGESTHLNLGVYESNPLNLDEDRGFYLGFGGATGTFYAAELQWAPPGHAGSIWKAGVWYDTSDADDVVLDVQGRPRSITAAPAKERNGRHGFHANFVQTLRPAAADGSGALTVIGNAAFADKATNRLRSKMALGMSYTGLFASRPRDDIAIGIGRTEVNDRVTAAQDAVLSEDPAGPPRQTAEYVAEAHYSWRPSGSIVVRPYVQYIRHPGGLAAREHVVIPGVKVVAPFR